MKVVVNIEPDAAFSLSHEAVNLLSYLVDRETLETMCQGSNRAHPALAKVVEDLGPSEVSAGGRLWVVKVPDTTTNWTVQVDEDGIEYVRAGDRTWHWDDWKYDFG